MDWEQNGRADLREQLHCATSLDTITSVEDLQRLLLASVTILTT
jgi:hypothetical protein